MSKKEYLILPLLFIISFSYLIFFCKYGFNIADEGVPLSGALRIMRGEVPLKDFQGYMPGVYYFYYVILKIFGMDILTVRYVISFLTAIMIVMYYLASKKVMSSFFSLFGSLIMVTVPGPYYVRFLNFFILLNIMVFYVYLNERTRASFYMGLIGGITFLFRQDLGLFVFFLAAIIFYIVKGFNTHGKFIAVFSEIKGYISGYFLIILPFIAYYLYEDKLFYILSANYNAFFGGYQKVSLPFPDILSSWYESGLFYVPVLIYTFALFHIIYNLRKNREKREIYKLYIFIIGILSFNQAIWRTHPENIVKVISPGILLYFYFFASLYSKMKINLIVRWVVLIIFSIIPLSYVYAMNNNYGTYIGSMTFSLSEYKFMDAERAKIYAPSGIVSEYTEIVSYIKENTGQNDKIFIVPFTGIPLYFLSDRINPAYFEWILPPEPDIYPDIEERVIDSLIKDKTKLIVYVDFALDGLENRRFKNYAPKLHEWIMENYYLSEMIGEYQILKLGYSHSKNIFFDEFDSSIKESQNREFIIKRGMKINGESRAIIFEHPPSVIKYKMKIPEKSLLNFGIAVDPRVWDKRNGDGVTFEVTIKDSMKENILFSRYINPKVNEDERKWIDSSVDLSEYRGKEVILSLKTSPGPAGNNEYDWAGWSKLEFVIKD